MDENKSGEALRFGAVMGMVIGMLITTALAFTTDEFGVFGVLGAGLIGAITGGFIGALVGSLIGAAIIRKKSLEEKLEEAKEIREVNGTKEDHAEFLNDSTKSIDRKVPPMPETSNDPIADE